MLLATILHTYFHLVCCIMQFDALSLGVEICNATWRRVITVRTRTYGWDSIAQYKRSSLHSMFTRYLSKYNKLRNNIHQQCAYGGACNMHLSVNSYEMSAKKKKKIGECWWPSHAYCDGFITMPCHLSSVQLFLLLEQKKKNCNAGEQSNRRKSKIMNDKSMCTDIGQAEPFHTYTLDTLRKQHRTKWRSHASQYRARYMRFIH